MSNSIVLPTEAYSNEKASEIFKNDTTGINTANYINGYVFKIIEPVCYFMWNPSLQKFLHYKHAELFGKNGIIQDFTKTIIKTKKY
jgi:hypothetical protein